MAISKQVKISGIEYRYTTNCITVHKCDVFMENDVILGESNHHAEGFMPDRKQELLTILNGMTEELAFVDAKWTAQVVEDYRVFRENQEQEFNNQ